MTDGLAARQAALVRALVAGAEPPEGFDRDALATASRALLRKRAQEVGRRYPRLTYACGDRFQDLYCAWAKDRPKTTTYADARAFADHLTAIGLQPVARSRWPWRHRKPATL
ncbi:hypothetical protein JGU71_10130 [Antrihabitans sp. YC3-6]|uniref:SCO6045-like C-terminal domain-containing protein n=1 Tax=Antrihabitans stalagmiti TaxID=2799499 RepID=A0A934NPX1_9NOCA|nr:hypothetical protein [Antrihabitans stalagmiti]MBJ8339246.1 hypothetical protein [Antrihabitans stalagmiti]